MTVVAIGLALGLPPTHAAVQNLHTSTMAYRFAVAAVLIPYVVIWYFGFYAFAKLREYSRLLKDTKDGGAFQKITTGMGVLAFSLVVPLILSQILNVIGGHHPGLTSAITISNNYIDLFPGLLAFILLYNGARKLIRTARGSTEQIDPRLHGLWFLLLCVVFSDLVIESQVKRHVYHLGLPVLILTFIVPYIYGWGIGLLTAYLLKIYAKTVHGSLYRRAIKRFAGGITLAITASIAGQFVDIAVANWLGKSLGIILLIEYVLLILIAVGLGLMASGTKRLQQIEEA